MYTVVLMAAMTTSIDVPDFGHRHGCHCGYGGCYGGGWYGAYSGGGWCGGYGGYSPYHPTGGSYGGYFVGTPYRGSAPGTGGAPPRAPERVPAPPPPPAGKGEKEDTTGEALGPAPATIIVTLPAGATLRFDNTPTQSTSPRRVFQTPPLEPGQDYYYTLTAQAMQDGQPVTVSRRVDLRAGQTARVALSFPTAAAAASR
jgi:uncharacterized protein (TIGR03000 family)